MAPSLGLGLGVASSNSVSQDFLPSTIANLTLWLKVNENIFADELSNGDAVDPDHSTTASTMVNGDRISAWNAYGGTSINATQDTTGDKARWSTTSGEVGGIKSPGGNKHMDLDANITFDANTDFTIAIRFNPLNFSASRSFLGHSTAEFFRLDDADSIRIKTDGTTSDFDSGTAMQADKDITIIIVRSDGSTGNINIFVRGEESGYFDGTTTGTAWGDEVQDTEEIIISNILAQQDNAAEFAGTVKDIVIYDGTAVSAAQRKDIFDYIEGQDY
jgi:hypothetical protein